MSPTPLDRFPPRTRDALSADERAAYDEIVGSRGMLPGPASLTLHAPEAARAYDAWSRALWRGVVPIDIGELVFLYVAHVHRCRYQWINHADKARRAGLPQALIVHLGEGRAPPEGTSPDHLHAWRFVHELLSSHAVSDEAFAAIEGRWGMRGAAELGGLCALAASVALLLNLRQPPVARPDAAPF